MPQAVQYRRWTGRIHAPHNLNIPFEILLIEMNSGAVLAKFAYLWGYDENNKTVD
jgi:hypothetical protein